MVASDPNIGIASTSWSSWRVPSAALWVLGSSGIVRSLGLALRSGENMGKPWENHGKTGGFEWLSPIHWLEMEDFTMVHTWKLSCLISIYIQDTSQNCVLPVENDWRLLIWTLTQISYLVCLCAYIGFGDTARLVSMVDSAVHRPLSKTWSSLDGCMRAAGEAPHKLDICWTQLVFEITWILHWWCFEKGSPDV